MRFFALASDRCAEYVKVECEKLKLSDIEQTKGGVYFKGDFKDGERFCLYSFFSTRLLAEIDTKKRVNSQEELYEFAKGIEWEKYIPNPDKTFLITASGADTPWCKNILSASLKIKDAICDRQKELFDRRSNIDKENPDVVFHLFLNNSNAYIYVDFSSRSLSKRHYREVSTPVYLQENIASALLGFSPFVTLLSKGRITNVVDPFVGSGTILIEAALIASGSVPGLIDSSRFAFMNLPDFNKEEWDEVLSKAVKDDENGKAKLREYANGKPLFFGYDIDESMLNAARINAQKAGVAEFISFESKDALTLSENDIPPYSCIVTDPPYGKRIEAEGLSTLYFKFAKNTEHIIDGGSLTLITSNKECADIIPYNDKRVFNLLNGAMNCFVINKRFLSKKEIAEKEQKEKEERNERLTRPLRQGALALYNTLLKNKNELESYFAQKNVSCYRIYDGGCAPFNAAMDVFENKWVVISEYSSSYTEKDDASRAKDDAKIEDMKVVIERLGFAERENIFIKTRKRMLKNDQYVKSSNNDEKLIIHEHDLNFLVNFTNYIDNGIFLDSRLLRQKIKDESRDKRFLNLFCYTGTATVHAAKGQALSTVSVDSSSTYLNWTKDNMRINDFTGMNHFYYQEDVMSFMKSLDRKTKFDLVFLDPPTFSNSHSRASFDIQKDHEFLIMLIMNHLEKNGKLIFCTNFRDFKLSERTAQFYNVKETTDETIDVDFKNRKYNIHRSFEITHKPFKLNNTYCKKTTNKI